MLLSLVVLVAFLTQFQLGACEQEQLYYWVDRSCDGKIPYVVGDTIRMAASAVSRLQNPLDQNQRQLFTRLFKTGLNDEGAIKEVIRTCCLYLTPNKFPNNISIDVMGHIGSLLPTLDRPSSDVRIYCDNDQLSPSGRWSPVPDKPGDKKPNSRRTDGVDKEYEDGLNGLTRSTRSMGCLTERVRAVTYRKTRNRVVTDWAQNPRRSAITVR